MLYKNAKIVSVLILIIIISIIFTFWFMSEKSTSYSEPYEALIAIDKDLLLIPSYKINGNALFFFMKDKNNLGATYVHEGVLGWKAGTLTWAAVDNNRSYEKLNGYRTHDDSLIYGMIKYEEEQIVKMDENKATFLMLDVMLSPEIVEQYQLEDLCIWYFETDNVAEGKTIELINPSGEVIDLIRL